MQDIDSKMLFNPMKVFLLLHALHILRLFFILATLAAIGLSVEILLRHQNAEAGILTLIVRSL